MFDNSDTEVKARRILEYLRAKERYSPDFLPRPFFIEITGTPSAGKTTTIKELDKFLRRKGFRVWMPQEGAEVIRHISRSIPLYNLRTCLYALAHLIDEAQGHKYDIVIFDRCIFDAYCWMMYWEEKGKLSIEEKSIFQAFALSHFWAPLIDAAYFMTTDPHVAGEREMRIAISKELGETTSPESVRKLVQRYRAAFDELSPLHPQLRMLDTTHISEEEMVRQVSAEIIDILESKTHRPL